MQKNILTCCLLALFPISVALADDAAELAELKTFKSAAENVETVFTTGFETPEEAARKKPAGFAIKPGEGRDGSAALFYERTDPTAYPLYGVRLNSLVPGQNYVVTAWVRGEDIRTPTTSKNVGAICVEYSQKGKWAGGFYSSSAKVGSEWQKISLFFQAKADSTMTLQFYFQKKVVGKIWFDDVVVRTQDVPHTVLLTRPDRLSFFGENGRIRFRIERKAMKNAWILAGIRNGDQTRELLLKPEVEGSSDYSADVGPLQPGPVEITAKLADLDRKLFVAEMTYPLTAYPATAPPKNACTIDEYGRAIVDGKPFMPLGVFGFAKEENYQRLVDAGFNCLQLYPCLGLKGKVDHKDPVKNVREALDLIDKYGLKLIFSLKDQMPHKGGVRKKWGDAEGIDAVTELAVQTVKDHPALLAWYVSDEEPRDKVPAIFDLRCRISRIDPWHPIWTLTDKYTSGVLPYYAISGDLLGVDPYPISMNPNMAQSIKRVRVAMESADMTGIPVWAVPQIFNWGAFRMRDEPEKFAKSYFPTTEEMRAMMLYFAMLGAKGFVPYGNNAIFNIYDKLLPGSGTSEREWAKVVESIKPIKALEPFVLSTKKPLPITVRCEPEGAVDAGALLDDAGNFRVIVIGTGGKAEGTFTLPDELLRLKKEPLRSTLGKTEHLGGNRYRFRADAVDSDVLE